MCKPKSIMILIVTLSVQTLSPCLGQSLTEELGRLDAMRNGPKTPLEVVDHYGDQLLNKYSNPKDQGQIYSQLAHIHAQSGLLHPEKLIAYANKALQCPLAPSQQMRLYTYWGDAVRATKEKKPFAAKRRDAAAIYLKGLRELVSLNLNLPEKPPERELMTFFNGPDEDEENKRKNDEQVAKSQQIDFQREMINHRDVLQGQIVSIYGRRPVATQELKALATSILGEGKELDRLMAAVNDKVAKLPPEPVQNPTPMKTPVPTVSSQHLYLSIAIGAGAFLAAALLLLSRWRARRDTGSNAAQ